MAGVPFYTRGDQQLKDSSTMSAVVREFETERDNLDTAFTAVAAGIAAAVLPVTNDWTTPPVGTVVGEVIYDTTLSKPFWWDGAGWNDAAGVVHP